MNAVDKDETHIDLISHLLKRMKYNDKNEKMLSHHHELAYAATPENIKEKLY